VTSTRAPSCRVPPRLVRRRKPRPAVRREPAIGWDGLAAAVAVLTARQADGADLRHGVLRAERPDRVIFGLEIVAAAALQILEPEDSGARALEALGELAARKSAGL
jgi:hypothetical protein